MHLQSLEDLRGAVSRQHSESARYSWRPAWSQEIRALSGVVCLKAAVHGKNPPPTLRDAAHKSRKEVMQARHLEMQRVPVKGTL